MIRGRGRVTLEELAWDARRVRARLVSPVAQRLGGRGPGGERVLARSPGRPVEVAFRR